MEEFDPQRRLCEAIARSVCGTMGGEPYGGSFNPHQGVCFLPAPRSEVTRETKILASYRAVAPRCTLPCLEVCGRRWNISVSYIPPIRNICGPIVLEGLTWGIDKVAASVPAGWRRLSTRRSRTIQSGSRQKSSTTATDKMRTALLPLNAACGFLYGSRHPTEKRFIKPLICVVEPFNALNGPLDALLSLGVPTLTSLKEASVSQLSTGVEPWCVVRIQAAVCLPVNQLKVGPNMAGQLRYCAALKRKTMRLDDRSVWDALRLQESASQMCKNNALEDLSKVTCESEGTAEEMEDSEPIYTAALFSSPVKCNGELLSCGDVQAGLQHNDSGGVQGDLMATRGSSEALRLSLTLPILSAKQRLMNEDIEGKNHPIEVYSLGALTSSQSVNGFFPSDASPTPDVPGASGPSRSYLLTALLLPGVTSNRSVSHTMNNMAHVTVDSSGVQTELKTAFSSMRKCSQRKRVRFLPISSSCIHEYQPFDWDAATPSSV